MFELHLAFSEMALCRYSAHQQDKFCQLVLRLFDVLPQTGVLTPDRMAALLAEKLSFPSRTGKELQREQKILSAVYRHLNDPDISLQSLGANELYMNADYLGKVFF